MFDKKFQRAYEIYDIYPKYLLILDDYLLNPYCDAVFIKISS